MKAVVLEALCSDFAGCTVETRPVPELMAEEVLVRVEASGLSFVDLLMTTGSYQTKPQLPFVLGSDVAGRIEAIGRDVTHFDIGQAVMGMRLGGAFAEYVAMPATALILKPVPFTFSQAAAFGAAYYTAYVALTRCAHIKPGQWLLVHGATGGVGLAAVDLGCALGLKVIAASASSKKLDILRQEYAVDAQLDSSKDAREEISRITGGVGVDVIFDPVGGDVFDRSLRYLAFNGRYLIVGFASGRIPEIRANIPLLKGVSLIGVRAGEYGRRFPEHAAEDRQALWQLASEGALRPRVHAEYSLEDWRAAFQALKERQIVGRVVLTPNRG